MKEHIFSVLEENNDIRIIRWARIGKENLDRLQCVHWVRLRKWRSAKSTLVVQRPYKYISLWQTDASVSRTQGRLRRGKERKQKNKQHRQRTGSGLVANIVRRYGVYFILNRAIQGIGAAVGGRAESIAAKAGGVDLQCGQIDAADAGGDDALVVVRIDAHQIALQIERALTNSKMLQLIFVQIRPPPYPGVDDMRKAFPTRHLQIKIRDKRISVSFWTAGINKIIVHTILINAKFLIPADTATLLFENCEKRRYMTNLIT